jgi:hypothetical protein
MTWSIDWPARTSSAIVRFGMLPVSHAATVTACPSIGAQVSETMVSAWRWRSIGFRICVNSKSDPAVAGVQ